MLRSEISKNSLLAAKILTKWTEVTPRFLRLVVYLSENLCIHRVVSQFYLRESHKSEPPRTAEICKDGAGCIHKECNTRRCTASLLCRIESVPEAEQH